MSPVWLPSSKDLLPYSYHCRKHVCCNPDSTLSKLGGASEGTVTERQLNGPKQRLGQSSRQATMRNDEMPTLV